MSDLKFYSFLCTPVFLLCLYIIGGGEGRNTLLLNPTHYRVFFNLIYNLYEVNCVRGMQFDSVLCFLKSLPVAIS
jgi:hypothetical protein